MRLYEIAQPSKLPATQENIQIAKDFLLRKWIERGPDPRQKPPTDLSGACKAGSLFASKLFGGKIIGNEFHQWAELEDGTKIDFSADAADVAVLNRGEIPDYARPYAARHRLRAPGSAYAVDGSFLRSEGHAEAMKNRRFTVDTWVKEFRTEVLGIKPTEVAFEDLGAVGRLTLFKRQSWYYLTRDGEPPEGPKGPNVIFYISVDDAGYIYSWTQPVPREYRPEIEALLAQVKVQARDKETRTLRRELKRHSP